MARRYLTCLPQLSWILLYDLSALVQHCPHPHTQKNKKKHQIVQNDLSVQLPSVVVCQNCYFENTQSVASRNTKGNNDKRSEQHEVDSLVELYAHSYLRQFKNRQDF